MSPGDPRLKMIESALWTYEKTKMVMSWNFENNRESSADASMRAKFFQSLESLHSLHDHSTTRLDDSQIAQAVFSRTHLILDVLAAMAT